MKNRLNWEQTKLWLSRRGSGSYSVVEFASGLYVNCQSQFELHTTVCASPSFRQDPDKALKQLRFYTGRPVMAIDMEAADKLRAKRKKMKYQDVNFISDQFGGLIMDREIQFDPTAALADYALFIEARKKIHELQHPTTDQPGPSEGPTPAGDPIPAAVQGEGSPAPASIEPTAAQG